MNFAWLTPNLKWMIGIAVPAILAIIGLFAKRAYGKKKLQKLQREAKAKRDEIEKTLNEKISDTKETKTWRRSTLD